MDGTSRGSKKKKSRTIFQWVARTIRLNADHAGRLGGPDKVIYSRYIHPSWLFKKPVHYVE